MGSLGVSMLALTRSRYSNRAVSKKANNVIEQHFAKHNHDIESIILTIIGLILEHCSKA